MYHLKKLLIKHIEENLYKYIFLLIVFGAGVFAGLMFSRSIPENLSSQLSEDILSNIEIVSKGEFDKAQIMKISFLKNIRMFFIIFLCGFTLWLFPINCLMLSSYGFSMGFTIGFMSSCVGGIGLAIFIISMLFTFVLIVPIYIIISVISLNNSLNIKNSRHNSGRYFIIILLFFSVSLTSIFFDTLIVPNIIQLICSK